MLFNSYEFLFIYLPIVFTVYFILNRLKQPDLAKAWLALSSLFFYSWWNIHNLPILLGSILFNYWIGHRIVQSEHKRAWLVFGIIIDLWVLFYFKYYNFFLDSVNAIFPMEAGFLNIILPLGISFFTFTQITYLVDAYRKEAKEYKFVNYVLFVTFFPHLIAGPILHHKEMMPQFDDAQRKAIRWDHLSTGLLLLNMGLAKKVIVADTLALWAKPGFEAATLTFAEAWFCALSYTFQLYFDFSGYTDMALGIALFFNIRLPQNFNSPYKADSIIDFWRRWHMTLSRFLRDYLYIPLGGNRKGPTRRYVNLLITMLLGGLWHGAAWTFVLWGALHGVALVVNHLWRGLGFRMPRPLGMVVTFVFVVVTWVFFRAESIDQAMVIIEGMFDFTYMGVWDTESTWLMPYGNYGLMLLLGVYAFVVLSRNSEELAHSFAPTWKWVVVVAVLFTASLLCFNRISEFLYFQF